MTALGKSLVAGIILVIAAIIAFYFYSTGGSTKTADTDTHLQFKPVATTTTAPESASSSRHIELIDTNPNP